MKKAKLILLTCLSVLLPLSVTMSQNREQETSVVLEDLFNRLLTSREDEIRLRINDSIKLYVEQLASSERIFSLRFSNLKRLGQITSPDSLVKILTWNLIPGKGPGRYYCYIIKRSAPGEPNTVFRLEKAYDQDQIRTDSIYGQSDWYGALYYDIRPFGDGKVKSWILLGINYSDPFTTRKIIDVLSFAPDNRVIFGRNWFYSDNIHYYRYVIKYSATAIISLRFASDSSIVFDHLVPLPVEAGDNQLQYGPDYSSDAFIYRDGVWELSINVEARNVEK